MILFSNARHAPFARYCQRPRRTATLLKCVTPDISVVTGGGRVGLTSKFIFIVVVFDHDGASWEGMRPDLRTYPKFIKLLLHNRQE